MSTAPIADEHAVEAPVMFQYLVERVLIVAVVLVLIEVVGAHHSPRFAFLHCCLEARQIDFVQGSVADDDVHLMAIFLVVVQAVMFHATRHAAALQALNVRHNYLGCQVRVFAHVLEVAASERRAVDVYTWP